LTSSMFVADQARLEVGFPVALARLENLARGSSLTGASRDIYDEAVTALIRVGPLGATRGVSRLVSVTFVDLVTRNDSAILGIRWNAVGPGGGLFPAFDANIVLTADGERASLLRLEGTYRPPLGLLGARLDMAIMNRVAVATIRSFTGRVASAIAHPAGSAALSEAADPSRLSPEPDAPGA
jgi:hypothetical protein